MRFRSAGDLAVRYLTGSQPGQGVSECVSAALPGCVGIVRKCPRAVENNLSCDDVARGNVVGGLNLSQDGACGALLSEDDSTGSRASVYFICTWAVLLCISRAGVP